jgi:hypothetical protein
MSFRRDTDAARRWEQWLHRHRDRLLEIGVPLVLYENERNWQYFVEHGYFAAEGSTPIFDVDRLPPEQARALCQFLEVIERDWEHHSSAMNRLRFVLSRGSPSR